MKIETGRVLCPFLPRYEDELAVSYNNIVTILEEENNPAGSDWIYVEHKGEKGYIPKNFIEKIDIKGIEVKALADFKPDENDPQGQYLSFLKGETFTLLSYDSSGWDTAVKDSQIGAIPHTYIEIQNPTDITDIRDLFFEPDNLAVVNAVAISIDTSYCEAFSKDLTLLFEHHDLTFRLLKLLILDELDRTQEEGTLFRKNNLCSYVMTTYARLIGKTYLKNTLAPLIQTIASSPHSCEIDPHRVAPDEVEENMLTLRKMSQMVFHSIMESVSKVPMALKMVCSLLRETTVKKFQNSRRKVVGGFYFLRFICPAVVSPESFGVIDKIDSKTRRALILISKIIQTLSNGVVFGQKESYMIPMNSFINENLENVHYVLDKISTLTQHNSEAIPERLPPLSDDDYNQCLYRLHGQIYGSLPRVLFTIRAHYTNSKLSENAVDVDFSAEVEEFEEGIQLAEHIRSVCLRAGPPFKHPPPAATPVHENTPSPSPSPSPSHPTPTSSSSLIVPSAASSLLSSSMSSAPLPSSSSSSSSTSPRNSVISLISSSPGILHTVDDLMLKKKRSSEKKAKIKISKSPPPPEGDVIVEGYILKKTKGNFGVQWLKRYYSMFCLSTKLYYANTPEELKEGKFSCYELLPGYNVMVIGRSKNPNGWEVRILTSNMLEINLIFLTEEDLKGWTSAFERRLSEIMLPKQSIAKTLREISDQQAKFEQINAQIEATRGNIVVANSEDVKREESKALEQLVASQQEVLKVIDKLSKLRDFFQSLDAQKS